MTPQERAAINLAIGRILRMASRPEKAGDAAEYERCKRIIIDLCGTHDSLASLPVHDFARDYKYIVNSGQ